MPLRCGSWTKAEVYTRNLPLRVPHRQLFHRYPGDVIRTIKAKRQFDLLQSPSIHERDCPVDRFEVPRLGGIGCPPVWSLEIEARGSPSQQSSHKPALSS